MSTTLEIQAPSSQQPHRGLMRAAVFQGKGRISIEEKAIPKPGFGEAVIQVRLTTICGTDVHILRGEYPVKPGLTIGHEAVGVIHELGPGVQGYETGQRVLVGAITPCGQCLSCLEGHASQCGGESGKPLGGWRLGNTIDGAQAEYMLVPNAQANLAPIPNSLADEQVLLLADIASTGFGAAESGEIRLGDNVAIFAQGPIGLCATLGAKLMGAAQIIVTDREPFRLQMAERFGATAKLLPEIDVLREIRELTGGRGADVAIEALGTQETFELALRALKPGGILSSVGVYSGHLNVPLEGIAAGLGDHTIRTTLCPGGKERMIRLMRLVESKRIDLTPLFTHLFPLTEIEKAYQVFSERKEHVLKVAIRVS